MLVGIQDDAAMLQGNPATTFDTLQKLRAQIVRINLFWGGPLGVAQRKPHDAFDPDDPAYDWGLYDRAMRYAAKHKIKVLFSIWRTPAWAGGTARGNHAPAKATDLEAFAYAAAMRYSGTFVPFGSDEPLPAVRYWLAWNEPNNPNWLSPQYSGRKIASAKAYKKICEAIWKGVHETNIGSEQVGCGATGPRGNNAPRSSRPSIAPVTFMTALKKAGLKHFDAYAHHPYYGNRTQTPKSRPRGNQDVMLGNINDLIAPLTRYWGRKPLWITEYGFQTNPPDRIFGVSYRQQARYLSQAYAIARANRRIRMMIWFLLRDDGSLAGWQSGLLTAAGV
jgi:hypothetical protein